MAIFKFANCNSHCPGISDSAQVSLCPRLLPLQRQRLPPVPQRPLVPRGAGAAPAAARAMDTQPGVGWWLRLPGAPVSLGDVEEWLIDRWENYRKTIGKWWFNGIWWDPLAIYLIITICCNDLMIWWLRCDLIDILWQWPTQLLEMAIEIVNFPIKTGGSFHSYLSVYHRVKVDYHGDEWWGMIWFCITSRAFKCCFSKPVLLTLGGLCDVGLWCLMFILWQSNVDANRGYVEWKLYNKI